MAIFETLVHKAERLNLPPVAITFHPHPRVLVTPHDPPLLLTTPEEKIDILRDKLDGALIILKFDKNLRQMSAGQFINEILLARLGVKALVVGYNHSFGRDRTGNIDHLVAIGKETGFDVDVVGPVRYKDLPISSSRIRRAIAGSEWTDVKKMLGHAYPIHGIIVKGLGQGKKMGWPTINLKWSERKLLPAEGVYSCSAAVNGDCFKGMMFVGRNMLNPEKAVSVEANLFDFSRDVYGIEATLYPEQYIRPNARFDSMEALARQIAEDKKKVMRLIN